MSRQMLAWAVAGAISLASQLYAQQSQQQRGSVSASASSSSIIIVEPKRESELDKRQAEALDICLRIYRAYGSVEVKVVGVGKQQVVICQ
jgi:hypothetical protein